MRKIILLFFSISILASSCSEEKDLFLGYWVNELNDINNAYMYSYQTEGSGKTAEIVIETDGSIDLNTINIEIPRLKYNKSWLMMLTQDDCMQSAFCATWAAINNRPLSSRYYYDYVNLVANDLPTDTASIGKTLGITDGAGKEVRFAFTTTLVPEASWMDAYSNVALIQSHDISRFYRKNGLTWRNVIELLNYDTGIAFHDVWDKDKDSEEEVNEIDSIVKHYGIGQRIISEKLRGRGCKVLAEPNGNKNYIRAAWKYDPIQIMTAQNTKDGITVEKLYPFKAAGDLHGGLYERSFMEPWQVQTAVLAQLRLPKEERKDVHIGVHGTDYNWANLLIWVNDSYGKDGDNSVWMPSYEEYYEYTYNRVNGTLNKKVDGNKITITYTFPDAEYFYFPSTTINVVGLDKNKVKSLGVNEAIQGLSHAGYEDGYMVNIDCRSNLIEHATHYVEEYESRKGEALKDDAFYFTNRLKDSEAKTALMNRIK